MFLRWGKNKDKMMEMKEEEQVMPTMPMIGITLCPCTVQHKHKLAWCNLNNAITTVHSCLRDTSVIQIHIADWETEEGEMKGKNVMWDAERQ